MDDYKKLELLLDFVLEISDEATTHQVVELDEILVGHRENLLVFAENEDFLRVLIGHERQNVRFPELLNAVH